MNRARATRPGRRAARSAALKLLGEEVHGCTRCPRLVRRRREAARRESHRTGEMAWGRPLSGFGDPNARLVLVGLAPAARGGNRTGRVFTGDRSAEFLMGALWRAGFANQPSSLHRDDGLRLIDAYMTAAVRCVPPENRPTPTEASACRPFLERELRLLPRARVLLGLGAFAFAQLRSAASGAYGIPRPRGEFTHGAHLGLGPELPVIWGCYHPSPRNVQTGLFSATMFDELLRQVRRELATDKA